MTSQSFTTSLKGTEPPENINPYLLSLWYDGKGDWEQAHTIIQDIDNADAAWIHAYLHRKEGDISNADYWYHRAGRKRPGQSLDEEWTSLVEIFLTRIGS